MEHLGDKARAELDLPPLERIKIIRSRRFYRYPVADRVLRRFNDLIEQPRAPRMPSVLLISPSGNGKTTLLDKCCREHPPNANPEGEGILVPTLHVQAPPSADDGQFYSDCLDRLCAEFNRHARPADKRTQLIGHLRNCDLRVLLCDELHNISSGHGQKQQHFLMVLKYLTNELQVPIVCAGTDEALSIIESDSQMQSRFEVIELPLWTMSGDLLDLLNSIEQRLPLKKPSQLATEEVANLLLSISKGTLSRILERVTAAAVSAIASGEERVTRKLLRDPEPSAHSDPLRDVG